MARPSNTTPGDGHADVTPPVDHLALEPATATIELGASQPYQAFAVDKAGNRLREVTDQTGFYTISSVVLACAKASCTPTEVGDHTVTGTAHPGQRTVDGYGHPDGDRPGGQPATGADPGGDPCWD